MSRDTDQNKPIIHRARDVAAGFADLGLTQAEDFLRRMSPEGRELARREREARARRQNRMLMRLSLAAAASLIAWVLLAAAIAPGAALAAALALMLILTTIIFIRADPRAPGREALAAAPLSALGEEAIVWIAAQRRGLPPPALEVADAIGGQLEDLMLPLGRLDPHSPAADAIGKLIAVELPDLVGGWRSVPISLRRTPGADGLAPDDHLLNGLRLIDDELSRVNAQLAHGSSDGIAVHGRYLELKYKREGDALG